jgi:hypothetical protein
MQGVPTQQVGMGLLVVVPVLQVILGLLPHMVQTVVQAWQGLMVLTTLAVVLEAQILVLYAPVVLVAVVMRHQVLL